MGATTGLFGGSLFGLAVQNCCQTRYKTGGHHTVVMPNEYRHPPELERVRLTESVDVSELPPPKRLWIHEQAERLEAELREITEQARSE